MPVRPSPSALAAVAFGWLAATAVHAQTLEKVASANKVTVGYREAAVPFSYLPGTARPVAFSVSFFFAGTRLLTKSGSGIRDYADLAGKPVAAPAGSTNEKVLAKALADRKLTAEIVVVKDYAEGLQAVEEGRAAALALDDVLLYGLRANAKDPSAFAVVGDALQVEPYGCMLRKDDATFKALVDRVLVGLMRSGEFERLYARWFESPIPPKGVTLGMPMGAPLRDSLRQPSDRPAQ